MDERPQWSPPREVPAADAGHAPQIEAPRIEPAAERPAPAPQAEAAPAAPARRRSTVREPAPMFSTAVVTPIPAPQPVPSVVSAPEPAAAEDASKPRRTGWWAKRLAGGDKG